ncbi:MAG: hypothetical protein QOG94_2716 [Solirubrobacteraceae bacterium]|jgi:hypothetical protein|nr:hypothetical protein [Solirubrobacteraceae bacterium]MEA2137671.1 hypothetical protein [Solirubrobacteraceae bacterium]
MPDSADRLRDAHRRSTLALSVVLALVGVALVAVTLIDGGGPFARGVLFGVVFALAGGGRAYLTWRLL